MAASSEAGTMVSAAESAFQDAEERANVYPPGLLPPLRKVWGSKLEEMKMNHEKC